MKKTAQIETYVLLRENREAAIETLYERYGKKLYSYAATSWYLDEDQAWEMVYDTLYKCLEKIDEYTFTSEKKFGSFLFTVFCNNLRRQYRDRKKREERLSFANYNETLFEESRANPSLQTERKVQEILIEDAVAAFREESGDGNPLMECLEQCLSEMKDWERILLLLRSQDMPYGDIAKYINKPAEQLKVYYQRTRVKLENMLKEKLTCPKQG